MEVHLTPELEAGLARIAQHEGTTSEALLKSLASTLIQTDRRIDEGIQRGIDQADRGEFIATAEIKRRFA